MRRNILGLAAAMALCTVSMDTGATAEYSRGSPSVSGHFRSSSGHGAFRRGAQRHRFVPSLELADWDGGWWAGYHYCGGWAYKYGYAPYSCYIFGGW
jgi:hypothetical protein